MQKPLTCVEICAGAGGQALGLAMAGFVHVALVEYETDYCNTLNQNRPEWNVICTDVREFDGKPYKGVDLLAGGVPCPPFSIAGKQLGKDDERDLFPEALRLIKEMEPRAIMLENVRGFLDRGFTEYRQYILKSIEKLGYDKKNIYAITMPCFGTTSRTKNNALGLMEELGVTSQTVNIADVVRMQFKNIDQDENVHDVTYENVQARERTEILMNKANQIGGLVIGTGDLSEVALGWSTYNGDHMSMYAVNVSVPKTLVRYLVDYVSSLYKGQVLETILQDVLDTPVSPELLPQEDDKIVQKTEDIVGPYELHDFFIYHMVRFGDEPRKLYKKTKLAFKDKYDKDTIKKWLRLFYWRFFSQQFKRSCIPDGPKVGSVALSPRGDWRMPSDANVQIWLDEVERI